MKEISDIHSFVFKAGANNAGLTSHFGFSATTVSQINTRTVSTISSDKVIVCIFFYSLYYTSSSLSSHQYFVQLGNQHTKGLPYTTIANYFFLNSALSNS